MIAFFVSLILYLCTLFPGVAQYRDTGEMVSVAHTLGIAHPPGYPLYTLLSKVTLLILPFAGAGYRLNVLSAVAGAATVWLLYRIFRKLLLSPVPSVFLSLLFATSYLQWYLSLVSEMYTLNTLFAALVLYLLIEFSLAGDDVRQRARCLYAAVFLFGIGLGNRMDLLLIGPAFAVMAAFGWKHLRWKTLLLCGLLFIAGFSVFAYLPLRSGAGPLLDWNHPADLSRLWGTLTRKTHGGTLDLISEAYASGENFRATILFYFRHLFTGFAYVGLPLGVIGLVSLWKRRRDLAIATFMSWMTAGPVFIYLSNMPPNSHALAILEAHFILPNLLFALWIGEGFRWAGTAVGRSGRYAVPVAAAVLFGINLVQHFPDQNKRQNFVAYDYSKNILRSSPKGSVLVMKKDVQLFSEWNKQLVEGRRNDVALISQGLSGSPWYIETFNRLHRDVYVGALRSAGDWKTLVENNRGKDIYFSGDSDYRRPDGYLEEADGLLNRVTKTPNPKGDTLLTAIYPYRGEYRYTAYREFFTPDLIDDYARALVNSGQNHINAGRYDRGRGLLTRAIYLRELIPAAYNMIAYSYIVEGKWNEAKEQYRLTIGQYEALQAMAVQFNALADVKEGIARDLAETYMALGVCAEKLNDDDEALQDYNTAITVDPGKSRAYFNRSVIYWKRGDWRNVVRELDNALRVDPQFQEAAYYRQLAQQKLR